jgi:uncharacterized DUF497 family protein
MAGRDEGSETRDAPTGLIFEWDETKAKANLEKHGVTFEEARTIFNDAHLLTFEDPYHSDHEMRYISLGMSSAGKLLLAIHTDRGEAIRLISCRRTRPKERRSYEAAQ